MTDPKTDPTTRRELFPGYFIEKCEEIDPVHGPAYVITGPRGKWELYRHAEQRDKMFVVIFDSIRCATVRGISWFKETPDGVKPMG